AREAVRDGVAVLYGASDAAVSVAFQPVREWLEFLARTDAELLRRCVTDGAGELARLSPALAGAAAPPSPDGDADRQALERAVVRLLQALARRRPLLVVADDVHWADAGTLHLLPVLARAAPEAPLVVLAAYRDRGEELRGETVDAIGELSRLEGLTRI